LLGKNLVYDRHGKMALIPACEAKIDEEF